MMAREPVRARGRANYEAILDAAAGLFAEQGFAETKIDEILQHAGGLSRGALYQFFDDKVDLAHTVVTRAYVMDGMDEVDASMPRLQSVIDASIALAVLTPRVPVVRAASRLATTQGMPFYGFLWVHYIPKVTKILHECHELGELQPEVDPELTTTTWVDAWIGRDMRYRNDYGKLPAAVARMNWQMARGVATPETLARLDLSVERGVHVVRSSVYADAYFNSLEEAQGLEEGPAAS
jgi:AcrR family transcriptional regulator